MTTIYEFATAAADAVPKPGEPPPNLESVLAYLKAREKAKIDAAQHWTLVTLHDAVMKFAPDLTNELVARWKAETAKDNAALEEMLAFLRQPSD